MDILGKGFPEIVFHNHNIPASGICKLYFGKKRKAGNRRKRTKISFSQKQMELPLSTNANS